MAKRVRSYIPKFDLESSEDTLGEKIRWYLSGLFLILLPILVGINDHLHQFVHPQRDEHTENQLQ